MKKSIINEIWDFLEINLDNYIVNHVFQDDKNLNEVLKNIQNKFNFKNFPYKIVCLDISHTSWKNPSGGMSAMLWWILKKKEYRQFKIPKELWWDDYESLKYCLNKYFSTNTVDLVILDGGKWQLNIVNDLPNDIVEKIDFIGLWKWSARKRWWKIAWNNEIFYTFEKEIPLDYSSFEDKLFIKLRDEAHRFSNRYRKIQDKKDLHSKI